MERQYFYVYLKQHINNGTIRECDGEDDGDAAHGRKHVRRSIIHEHVSDRRGPKSSEPKRHHRRENLPGGNQGSNRNWKILETTELLDAADTEQRTKVDVPKPYATTFRS